MHRSRGGRASVMLLAAGAGLAACGDDGPDDAAVEDLCLVVRAWSDASVEAVDAFRIDSRELDRDSRRARYARAFADVASLHEDFADRLADLELPPPIPERLDGAMAVVEQTIADGAAEAEALPDDAYDVLAVRDGSLFTGVEKAKAVVFQALNELADEPAVRISRGCGRRGALDLSPSATFP